MKERQKKCVICEKMFFIISNLKFKKQACSNECYYELVKKIKIETNREYNKKVITRICEKCKITFLARYRYIGTNKCKKCIYEKRSNERIGSGNPFYKHGYYSKKGLYHSSSKIAGLHTRACAKYKKYFLSLHNFLFCEVCGVNGGTIFSTHHIYFASRFPKHPELHNFKNLILVCYKCHRKFHANSLEDTFKKLEFERGLKILFYDKKKTGSS